MNVESSMSKHTPLIWLLIVGHGLTGFFMQNSALQKSIGKHLYELSENKNINNIYI